MLGPPVPIRPNWYGLVQRLQNRAEETMDHVLEIVEEVAAEQEVVELSLDELKMVGGGTGAVSLF